MSEERFAEALIYRLLLQKESAYATMLQRVQCVAIEEPEGILACVGASKAGDLYLTVNSFWFNQMDEAAQLEVLKHEVLHIAFGHMGRRGKDLVKHYCAKYGAAGATLVNFASDMVVNQFINLDPIYSAFAVFTAEAAKYAAEQGLPAGEPWEPVTITKYKFPENLTVEEYCVLLEKQVQQLKSNKVANGAELSAEDSAAVEEAIKGVIAAGKQAEERGKHCRGLHSADLSSYVEQIRRASEIPWQAVLRRHESRFKTTLRRPTMYRPSRRNPEHLGYKRKRKLHLWFVVDTSGSMNDELQIVDSELQGLHNRGASIEVIHQDAEIKKRQIYCGKLAEFHGRGGTEFSAVFTELLDTPRSKRPALVVYYTDGEGGVVDYLTELAERKLKAPFGECEATGTPVLWLLSGNSNYSPEEFTKQVAGFGQVLKVRRPANIEEGK